MSESTPAYIPTYLRISVTDRCDMCCSYCIPPGIVMQQSGPTLSTEEILRIIEAFAACGVTKVRFTGGEPLLRDDLIELVESTARISGINTIALTTNGRRLADAARDLKRAGLQTVNISLDSLDKSTFCRITDCDALSSVRSGIYTALQCGFERVKTNTVVMRGINDSEISAIARLTLELPLEVRFIELMPLGRVSTTWKSLYVSAAEIRSAIGDCEPVGNRASASAQLYKLPGSVGAVGIISPVSEHFCQNCSRVRVTSSGLMKPCLRTALAINIRPLLEQDDLAGRIGELIEEWGQWKLGTESVPLDPVQAEAMCAIGG